MPFFSPIGGGVWGGAEQKIEKEMVLSVGHPKYEGDGAVKLIILGFLQKKFGFRPKGTANLQFQHFWKDLFQQKDIK